MGASRAPSPCRLSCASVSQGGSGLPGSGATDLENERGHGNQGHGVEGPCLPRPGAKSPAWGAVDQRPSARVGKTSWTRKSVAPKPSRSAPTVAVTGGIRQQCTITPKQDGKGCGDAQCRPRFCHCARCPRGFSSPARRSDLSADRPCCLCAADGPPQGCPRLRGRRLSTTATGTCARLL